MKNIKVEMLEKTPKDKRMSIWYEGVVAKITKGDKTLEVRAVGDFKADYKDNRIEARNNARTPLNDCKDIKTDKDYLHLSATGELFSIDSNCWAINIEDEYEVYYDENGYLDEFIKQIKNNFDEYYDYLQQEV